MPKNLLIPITSSIVLVLKEDTNFINLLSSFLSVKNKASRSRGRNHYTQYSNILHLVIQVTRVSRSYIR